MNDERLKLKYENQLEFKKWAKSVVKLPDFYFDYITCVDSSNDMDIPGVVADGSMTWGEALTALRHHFNI